MSLLTKSQYVERIISMHIVGANPAQRVITFNPPIQDVYALRLLNCHSHGFTPDVVHVVIDDVPVAGRRGFIHDTTATPLIDPSSERSLLGVIFNNNRPNLVAPMLEFGGAVTLSSLKVSLLDEAADMIALAGGQEVHVLLSYFTKPWY